MAGRRWRGLLLATVLLLAGAGAAAGQGQPERPAADGVAEGERLFSAQMTPADGLGPQFNATSCAGCHSAPTTGGMGPDGLGLAVRVGRFVDGQFDDLRGAGGPVSRRHTVAELGLACGQVPGIPPGASVTSVRNAPALFGLGLVDAIPDAVILAGAVPKGDGVQGRPNHVPDATGRHQVGRFGWKADTASLEVFVAEAFRNEHGITSPLFPTDVFPAGAPDCPGGAGDVEDDGSRVRAVTRFVAALPPLAGGPEGESALTSGGGVLFRNAGCVACHTPGLSGPGGEVRLYSDLLLHDMGPALDDGVVQGQAGGRDWRTTPLWGLGSRTRYLHDGRARTLRAAIQAHGGAAAVAAGRFRDLAAGEQEALLRFLQAL